MTGLREMIKRELARREEGDGKWPARPRHDRASPAAADVSMVDTLPADQLASGPAPAEPEHGPAWGKAAAELSGAVLQMANPPKT